MAGIRCLKIIPETFETLGWNFIKQLPVAYKQVNLVADSYLANSIKAVTMLCVENHPK